MLYAKKGKVNSVPSWLTYSGLHVCSCRQTNNSSDAEVFAIFQTVMNQIQEMCSEYEQLKMRKRDEAGEK